MSKRRNAELVEDIIEAITRIERYTTGLTLEIIDDRAAFM